MQLNLYIASFVIALANLISSASAEQRDFPTGEPGANVAYVDAGGPGHPTACVVTIAAGLPALAISIALFSNNKFTMTLASERTIPKIASDSSATIKINSTYIFARVSNSSRSGIFNVVNIAPVETTPMKIAYDAINHLVYNPTRIDVVADNAQLPSIDLPAEPSLAEALKACQHYMVTN